MTYVKYCVIAWLITKNSIIQTDFVLLGVPLTVRVTMLGSLIVVITKKVIFLYRHYYVIITSLLRHHYVIITSSLRHYYVIITSSLYFEIIFE